MKITNAQQFDALIAELEKNPCLAKGFRRGTVPSNFKQQWEEISHRVNAHGPPMRDGDGWQKVWRDLKFKTKRKISVNKSECKATGGGPYKQCTLSPLEESVANMLQFEKQLSPEGEVQGVDCPAECTEYEVLEPELETEAYVVADEVVELGLPQEEEAPTSSNNAKRQKENASVRKLKKTTPRQMVMEKHSAKQAKLLREISNNLGSVKRSLRDCNKYQTKMLEIEERKLMLMEMENKREEELHQSQIKINNMKLLIKERELQLLN